MGVLILRPTADLNSGHAGLGGDYFYQFINEDNEGSDGDATFLYQERSESSYDDKDSTKYTATSIFNSTSAIDFPIFPEEITVGCVAKYVGQGSSTLSYSFNNQEYGSANLTTTYQEFTSTKSASEVNLNEIMTNPKTFTMGFTTSITPNAAKGTYIAARVSQLYAKIKYKLAYECKASVQSGDNGISAVSTSKNYVKENDTVAFIATLKNGYVFDGWYDNNVLVSNNPIYYIKSVERNYNLMAKSRNISTKKIEVTYRGKKLVNQYIDDLSIVYNNNNMSNLPLRVARLNCKNKLMRSDIKINDYILNCKNTIMQDDITVTYRNPMVNLIPYDASMTIGGWDNNSVIDTTISNPMIGLSSSLRIDATADLGEKTSIILSDIPQVKGHKYYWRIYEYHTDETYIGKYVRSQIYWPLDEPPLESGDFKEANQWNMQSGINDRSKWDSGDKTFRVDFDNKNNNGSIWYTGFMLIDLTDTFSANNEPNVNWCDKNIPYFIGTI